MLAKKEWSNVIVISGGSVYPVNPSKGTLGYAFYYQVKGGEKKRKVVTGKSEDELKGKAFQFLEMEDEKYRESIRPKTFGEVGAEWFAAYKMEAKEKGKSYASVESRECSLKAINKVIADKPVKDIDNTVAASLIEACSKKSETEYYSRSHVDKLQQAFRMVMEYAKKSGYCTVVPDKVELSDSLTTVDKDSRFLDEEQIAELYKVLVGNPRYRTIMSLLLATGLRQEEAFALNVNDFNVMKDGTVEVRIYKTVVEEEGHQFNIVEKTKTKGSRRKVYIPHEVYEMVMEYYDHTIQKESADQKKARKANGMEGYIFVNKDMKPLNKRTFQRNLKEYIKNNSGEGMDYKVTLHMLRHTFASLQAENMGIDKVALLMGDSIATTSKMYQSLTHNTKTAVCENSSRLFSRIKDAVS